MSSNTLLGYINILKRKFSCGNFFFQRLFIFETYASVNCFKILILKVESNIKFLSFFIYKCLQ